MKKLSIFLAIFLSLGLFLAACGGDDAGDANETDDGSEDTGSEESDSSEDESGGDGEEASGGEDWVENSTVLTGGEAGTYYPLGLAMADVMSENTDASATGVSSGASVVNANELSDGAAEFGLLQNDIAFYAHDGSHMFEEVVDGFSGMFTMYPETIQIVTVADSGIETVEDLEGARVAVGDVGSGTEANANQILGAYDLTYDDINEEYMGFGDASTALQDGNVDAAFVTAGTPTSGIQELAASADVKIIGLDDDKIDQLIEEYPYYTRVDLDENSYDSFDATASTIAPLAMLVVSDELPEDQVYEMTKAIFENLDDIANAHVRGEDISLDSAQDGMPIDLHPGAQRYYDEQ